MAVGCSLKTKVNHCSVSAFIPEDPFYTTWWFIAMVAMSTFVVIVLVVAFLCITGEFI